MSKLVLYRGKWCLYNRDSSGNPTRRSLGTSDRPEAERRAADLQAFELLRTASNVRTIAEAWEARRKALEGRRTASNMEWSGKPILSFFGHMEPRHVKIAQFLGHSNPEITRKVYARYSPTYLRKAAEALEL